jgi:hypothetical protein
LTDFTAEQSRPAEVAAVARLELVHEETGRVVELPPADLERHSRKVRETRRSARPVDPLDTAV